MAKHTVTDTGRNPARWQDQLEYALTLYFSANPHMATNAGGAHHTTGTPGRFTRYLESLAARSTELDKRVANYLVTQFSSQKYDEMIIVSGMRVNTTCAHHLLPVMTRISFAYIPNREEARVVGLSKIPRFIKALASAPGNQEGLAANIVDQFDRNVHPYGCGAVIDGTHTCMACRGVEMDGQMRTTALRGVFRENHVKQEFLQAIKG